MEDESLEFVVGDGQGGARLDRWLAENSELNRSRLQRLIEQSHVSVNGTIAVKSGRKLKANDVVIVTVPPAVVVDLQPQDIEIEIIYEDSDIVVVSKQANFVVHPSHGHPDGTLVNALLHHCSDLKPICGTIRPGIVHRIDKDTSGLLVVAKSEAALHALQTSIKTHQVARRYLVITKGCPKPDEGTWRTLIGRHPKDRKRFAVHPTSGRSAVTHYRVAETADGVSLLDIELETGRTHQIRVHCTHYGHSIIGDQSYGRKLSKHQKHRAPKIFAAAAAMKRQALHAYQLEFIHPTRPVKMRFYSKPPPDLCDLVQICFGDTALEELVGESRVETISDDA